MNFRGPRLTRAVPAVVGAVVIVSALVYTVRRGSDDSDLTRILDAQTSTTTDPASGQTTATSSSTTSSPLLSTTSTTERNGPPTPQAIRTCGLLLCARDAVWRPYGATIYNPGLKPVRSGLGAVEGTIDLARRARLNAIRVTDFLSTTGDPATAPYEEAKWRSVDAMIAAADDNGMYSILELSDYRAILWKNCINPYTADWSHFIAFAANRVNTVSGRLYKNDPAIAWTSLAGEPEPVGTHSYKVDATGKRCTVTYTTTDLNEFYKATTAEWKKQGGSVLINTGGMGHLDDGSGIDWQTIFSLPTNDFCDIKTYGGMRAWAPNAATFCASIGKPIIDEEFGWQQNMGDRERAKNFVDTINELRALNFAGSAFWNLGYQVAPTGYDIGPDTPLTFAAVQSMAP